MNDWSEEQLGTICDIGIGKTPSRDRPDYWGPGLAWLSIADMNQGRDLATTRETVTPQAAQEANMKLVRPGTVVLSFKLSVGKVGIVRTPMYTNEAIARLPIRDHRRVLPEYLYWALQSIDLTRTADRAAKGVTLNKGKLDRIRLPVPPLPEQRRIAAILDHANALRTKRRAAIAQLDTLAQSIFLDMFGDPDKNPYGWSVRPVKDFVSDFQGGRSIDPEDSSTLTARRILKISAVTGMTFNPSESKPISDDHQPDPEHYVRKGDLLFSRANTSALVGAVAFVEDCPENVLLPDKLWRFVWCRPRTVEPLFVWMLFQTQAVRRAISQRATGTSGSMKNISKSKLSLMPTILPPLELQRRFVDRLVKLQRVRSAQQCSLAHLDALFSSLQHRAFRGEL